MPNQFPEVPRNPFWSGDQEGSRRALAAIERWRTSFAGWLGGSERDDGISEALATPLLELMRALPGETYLQYPYRLERFPELSTADGGDPAEALRRVLLWRAGVVDFLSDVWDTLGATDIGVEECQRISSLLTPVGMERSSNLCPLCLAEQQERHFDACAVQASWRSSPTPSSTA